MFLFEGTGGGWQLGCSLLNREAVEEEEEGGEASRMGQNMGRFGAPERDRQRAV